MHKVETPRHFLIARWSHLVVNSHYAVSTEYIAKTVRHEPVSNSKHLKYSDWLEMWYDLKLISDFN